MENRMNESVECELVRMARVVRKVRCELRMGCVGVQGV